MDGLASKTLARRASVVLASGDESWENERMQRSMVLAALLIDMIAAPATARPATPSVPMIFATTYSSVVAFPFGSNGDVVPSITVADAMLATSITIGRDDKIYVTHAYQQVNNITVYAPGAGRDVAPIATIAGAHTGLDRPLGIAVDAHGAIYVANATQNAFNFTDDRVTIYASGSNGDAAPIATIQGDNTGLATPSAIALDSNGNIYVANWQNGTITVYASGSHGNVKPVATITSLNPGGTAPSGIAVDSGGSIYEADADGVKIYAPGSNGDVAPVAAISAGPEVSNTRGVALDASGRIYVSTASGPPAFKHNVQIYPAGSSGNVSPVATIAGSKTGLLYPTGVAVDSAERIYVVTDGQVAVYSSGSNGDVAPVATITSKNTGLFDPHGLAIGEDGKVYVANGSRRRASVGAVGPGGSLTIYPSGANGDVAPIATIVGESTGLNSPHSIAVDSGGNVYVASAASIVVYSAAAIARGGGGDIAPVATLVGPHTGLLSNVNFALDSSGKVYAATWSADFDATTLLRERSSVRIFPAGSNGDIAPLAIVAGSHTQLNFPESIAVGSSGKIYVGTGGFGSHREGSIIVYPAGSNGDVTPIATIHGTKTGLFAALKGIAVDHSGNIYAAPAKCPRSYSYDLGAGSLRTCVNVYAPGANGNVAPLATIAIAGSRTESFTGVAIAPP